MKYYHHCLRRDCCWLVEVLCFLTIGTALGAQNSVVVWGSGSITNVPADLTNVASVSYGVALLRDGMVRVWGNPENTNVPPAATNVVAVAGSSYGWLGLRRDGSVIDRGGALKASGAVAVAVADQYGSGALTSNGILQTWGGLWGPPNNTSNGIAIAQGGYASLRMLLSDGTVLPAPSASSSAFTNIVAIADGSGLVGLRSDGSVVSSINGAVTMADVTNAIAVAAGSGHGLALKGDGTVVAWGNSASGQANVPVGLSNVVAVAAGNSHNLVLKADGTVVAWGDNYYGQTDVPAGLSNVAAIFAGSRFSLAIVGDSPPTLLSQPPDETVWASQPATFTVKAIGSPPLRLQWQFNGEIIEGATNSFYRIDTAAPADSGIYNVVVSNARGTAASRDAILLVKTNLTISAQPTSRATWFGSSVTLRFTVEGPGPLSYQGFFNGSALSGATNDSLLVANTGLENAGDYWATVSYPYGVSTSSVARLSVLAVAVWGSASYGATSVPTNLQRVAAFSAGGWHNLFLKTDGTVAASGYNFFGTTDVPQNLSDVVAVAAGYYHSLALRADGNVVGWGANDYDQISIPSGLTDVVCISAGALHSLALRGDGSVRAWGDHRYGQIQVPPGLTNVVSIAAGEYSSLALRADGTVEAWGFPAGGLTGTGIPQGLSNIVGIAAGGTHWLALRADGIVITWGSDYYGQQTTYPRTLSNVVAVAAGHDHSLALRRDGTVVAWGNNNVNQTSVPARLSNVVAITAGRDHSFALVAAGLSASPVQTQNPAWGEGAFSAQVPTLRGKTYYLQHRDSLSSPQWMMRPPVPGDGTLRTLVDSDATVPQRFYRIWQKP